MEQRDQLIGLSLALSSSVFIGASFIVKKRGLRIAAAQGLRAGAFRALLPVIEVMRLSFPMFPRRRWLFIFKRTSMVGWYAGDGGGRSCKLRSVCFRSSDLGHTAGRAEHHC